MKVEIVEEHGYWAAMEGLSYSKDQEIGDMPPVARRLAFLQDGHNKFLESIGVWLRIDAPRWWWQQIATYRCPQDEIWEPSGISTQSESTMHTITKKLLTQADFNKPIWQPLLDHLNDLITRQEFDQIIEEKPEGLLQKRMIKTNYKSLQNIYRQRRNHKMQEWHYFCDVLLAELQHPEFIWRCEK